MTAPKNLNIQPNIYCMECSCIPLLGINFNFINNNKNQKLSDLYELYSYCIYEHKNKDKNKKINKIIFDKLMIKNSEVTQNNLEIKCEKCKNKEIEYHCLDCQRNICKNCFGVHKTHKYYYNKGYISEKELEQIKNEYEKSRINLDRNLNLISKQIEEFELQLKKLKSLYKEYMDINEKLKLFSDYILKLYTDLVNKQEQICFPIYFNLKNILVFNPIEINLPESNISIESYTNILKDKIISGFYNIIKNSNFSYNLNEYNNKEKYQINYDLIKFNEFNKKEVEYDKILSFTENKFFGIEYYHIDNDDDNDDKHKFKTDIYNIKNQCIEASLKILPETIFYNKKYNLLIIINEESLYILDPKDFSIKQQISTNHKIKEESQKSTENEYSMWKKQEIREPEPGLFVFSKIISQNSFITIFKGDFRCLGEEYEKCISCNTNDIKIINYEKDCYSNFNYGYGDYSYLLIYEKKSDKFEPKKIIYLVKDDIKSNEVLYVAGKNCEVDLDETEGDIYCSFNFDYIFNISESEFIIIYESKIEMNRNQDCYYIIDESYRNETIYYYLDIKKQNKIEKKLFSTKEKSHLYKNEKDDIFYFLYKNSDFSPKFIEKFFSEKKLKFKSVILTKDINDINNIFIHRNTLIISNNEFIYFGKMFGDKFEIIDSYNSNSILFFSLKEKCFFCGKQINNINKELMSGYKDNKNFNNSENDDFNIEEN